VIFDDNFFDGIDFDEEESPQTILERDQRNDAEFWRLLKDNRNEIKRLDGAGHLSGGAGDLGHGASIFVQAKKEGGSHWKLFKKPENNWQKAYLLNYQPGTVTCVKRAEYESDHDFFLTVELSGCRFTLTDTHVMHIAADAGRDSAGRDKAENEKLAELNVALGRKRSVSVTSRGDSILYHPSPAAALADIARREAMVAMNGKMSVNANQPFITESVANLIAASGTSEATLDRAVQRLRDCITGNVNMGVSVEDICLAFSSAVKGQLAEATSIIKGAFVVGIKNGAWKYYVLANRQWAEILPG